MSGEKRKNIVALITIGLIVLVLIAVCVVLTTRTTTPKIETLKQDLISEELDVDESAITDIKIETQTDGKEDIYKAIVEITYNDEEVEYVERYNLTYSKYNDWIFESVEDYEKDSWTKKPIKAPVITDFEKKCISKLYDDGEFTEYDKFEPVSDKTEVNLEDGKATFVFAVQDSSVLQSVTGEIKFDVHFNYEQGSWQLADYSYMDSYHTEHNLLQYWLGKGSHMGAHAGEVVEKNFALKVNNFSDGNATGVLTYEGKQYSVSGTITIPEEVGKHYQIDLFNISEKMRIEGFFTIDGEMYVTVDTAYKPDSKLYYPIDRYDVDMFVEQ